VEKETIEIRFDTFKEITENQYFKSRFEKNYYELMNKRRSRAQPPAGRRYKSDWYDAMDRAKQDNLTFFQENILSIFEKRSALSSKTRNVIEHVGNVSFNETIQHYQALEAARLENQTDIPCIEGDTQK